MTIEAIKRQWNLMSTGQFSKDQHSEDWQIIFVALVWVGLIIGMITFGACQKKAGKRPEKASNTYNSKLKTEKRSNKTLAK